MHQSIISFVILTIYPLVNIATTPILDATHICANAPDGDLVPNPYDCQSYFNCSDVPKLINCENGLHFDAINKVCVEPAQSNCETAVLTSATVITSSTASTSSDSSTNTTPDIGLWPRNPHPTFMAIDVVSGQSVDPMTKYDPQHIECRHFGAYFLPHPSNCQRYFICAYGHLHQHRCGRFTYWNYKRTECQLAESALCYNNATITTDDEWDLYADDNDNDFKQTGVSIVTATLPTSAVKPALSKPITICYIIDADSLTKTTQTTSSMMISSVPTPPRPSMATTTTTTSAPRVTTLKCPSDRQSYLSDPEDCSKYYICIVGIPVLTSCPKGLYWDQNLGYCDSAKIVNCFQKTEENNYFLEKKT